jgi:hypothetical protein
VSLLWVTHSGGVLIGDILDLLDRRTAAEFAAAMAALDQLAAVPAPVTLRKLLPYPGVMLADDLGGWRRITNDPPGNLDAWTVRHLDHLRALGDRAAAALTGDRLVHTANLILMTMCRSTASADRRG